MPRELAPPPVVARRQANELSPEELQAECQRYAIPTADVQTRMAALQLKYDDEYESVQHELEEFQKRLEEQQHRENFLGAVHNLEALEYAALAREPKIHAIIEQNIAPKRLVVRGLSALACCALLRAMRSSTSVLALDLANNKLTDVIAVSLGKMLEQNSALRSLDLGFNELTHQTLGALGRALRVNAVLETVVLESNPLLVLSKEQASDSSSNSGSGSPSHSNSGGSNIEAFTAAVAATSSLTALNLFSTQMSYEAGRALAQAFAKNHSIVALEVGGNAVLQSDVTLFASHLRRNQQRLEAAQSKIATLQSDLQTRAAEVQREHAKLAKQLDDEAWHDANAKQRAEVREQEEWVRARTIAEADVRRLLEIETMDKQYRERLEAERKPKAAKGKK